MMLTKEQYLEQAARRFGRDNPERTDLEHWVEMVRSGESAYAAAVRYLGEAALAAAFERAEPGWSFDRFGMSRTRLPDGRIACVAGEHEDHYDPDFCIYNDAIVLGPGDEVAIYSYPRDVFPPTDFHTATLVGNRVFLIGCLGYGFRRYGATPVYALDLATMAIAPVRTDGQAPGWIHRHRARLDRDGRSIRVSGGMIIRRADADDEAHDANERVFRLDVHTGRWAAFEGEWLDPPAPRVDWPPGWQPIATSQDARFVADGLALSVRPDNPLFADDYEPVAKAGESALAVLLRSRDDPEEFLVSEGPTWCGRTDESLKFETYRGIDTWLAAARRRGEWWWD